MAKVGIILLYVFLPDSLDIPDPASSHSLNLAGMYFLKKKRRRRTLRDRSLPLLGGAKFHIRDRGGRKDRRRFPLICH